MCKIKFLEWDKGIFTLKVISRTGFTFRVVKLNKAQVVAWNRKYKIYNNANLRDHLAGDY